MFQQKINKDTILHYGSMLLGAAVLSFGLFNVHSQSKITEGGILRSEEHTSELQSQLRSRMPSSA